MRIILFTLFLFSIIQSNAADYYWVGGGGNWNDYNSHWALSSGGIPGNAGGVNVVPSPFDNVFFDVNSGFTPTNNTVTSMSRRFSVRIWIGQVPQIPLISYQRRVKIQLGMFTVQSHLFHQ